MPQRHSRRLAALSTLFGTGASVAITIAQAFLLIPLCLTYLGAQLYGAWLWLVSRLTRTRRLVSVNDVVVPGGAAPRTFLAERLREIADRPIDEHRELGVRAREFMLARKTWEKQGERLAHYIRTEIFREPLPGTSREHK